MEDVLPHYLAIGVSRELFMDSCPAELKPYELAHKIQLEERNMYLYINGLYVRDAILSSIGNSGWFRGESDEPYYYPEQPYNIFGDENEVMDENRVQKEVDLFFAQESVRRANWKITHGAHDK